MTPLVKDANTSTQSTSTQSDQVGSFPESERIDGRGSEDIFEFARFRFDRRGRSLFRLDQADKPLLVPIGRTALDVLGVLVENQGDVVEREKIMKIVWRGKVVEDANLAVQIAHLRASIGRRSIQTVSGRGYRFVAPGKRVDPEPHPAVAASHQAGEQARPHLSIVVLPFTDLSEDGKQQYLADGMTDDLTTDLSRIDGMFVISRNTAFTYRNKPVDTKKIGRKFGVRYALQGSLGRAGNKVRVNAQLIDAETDAHLWADRFDCEIGDMFALQNEITGQIAVAVNAALVKAKTARPSDHPSDYRMVRGPVDRVGWRKQIT